MEAANRKAKQDKLDEKKQTEEMLAEIAQLEAQIAQATADTAELETKIPRLQNAVDQKTVPLNQLRQAHAVLEETVTKKKSELRRLEQASLEKKKKADAERASLETKIRALETRRKEQDTEMRNIKGKMEFAETRLEGLEAQHFQLENLNTQHATNIASWEQATKEAMYRLSELKIRKKFEPAEGGGWIKISGDNAGIWVPHIPLPEQENPFNIDLGNYKPQ